MLLILYKGWWDDEWDEDKEQKDTEKHQRREILVMGKPINEKQQQFFDAGGMSVSLVRAIYIINQKINIKYLHNIPKALVKV